MKFKLKIFLVAAAVSVLSFIGLSPSVAHASTFTSSSGQTICQGVGEIDSSGNCDAAGGTSDLSKIIGTVLNILSLVVGIAAVVMIIVAGLRYILSGGESQNVNNAKNTLIYAVVGLVVVALAQIIVHFVINSVS
ncbi:MAG TPA: hypothetical protein VMR34_00740 [Candidatus Saccharimonadales bacterium]|jgi:hypothetical protein|nr:hypothetical protein [Candidatus Saccharimonadales bacterium]